MRERNFWVYIVASRSHTLYIGFTSNIEERVWEHKNEAHKGFTKTYRCNRLVWYEWHATALSGIAREKQLKRWSRGKKIALIERENPAWVDLSEKWGTPYEFYEEAPSKEYGCSNE